MKTAQMRAAQAGSSELAGAGSQHHCLRLPGRGCKNFRVRKERRLKGCFDSHGRAGDRLRRNGILCDRFRGACLASCGRSLSLRGQGTENSEAAGHCPSPEHPELVVAAGVVWLT